MVVREIFMGRRVRVEAIFVKNIKYTRGRKRRRKKKTVEERKWEIGKGDKEEEGGGGGGGEIMGDREGGKGGRRWTEVERIE